MELSKENNFLGQCEIDRGSHLALPIIEQRPHANRLDSGIIIPIQGLTRMRSLYAWRVRQASTTAFRVRHPFQTSPNSISLILPSVPVFRCGTHYNTRWVLLLVPRPREMTCLGESSKIEQRAPIRARIRYKFQLSKWLGADTFYQSHKPADSRLFDSFPK